MAAITEIEIVERIEGYYLRDDWYAGEPIALQPPRRPIGGFVGVGPLSGMKPARVWFDIRDSDRVRRQLRKACKAIGVRFQE